MQRLFPVVWKDLTADHVEAFLRDQTDEGLTWEAKGDRQPHPDSVRKAVCGFANSAGGYLIVGAERNEDGWTLPGVVFSVEEPATWLASLIAPSGVTPVPWFDIKLFERPDGRHAAVVAVEQLAAPPCITASGIVYQRVSGSTLPVLDQRVLADLTEQGQAVRSNAEATALRMAQHMLGEPAIHEPQESLFSVALCPIGGPADKAAVLFTRSFVERFSRIVHEKLQADPMLSYSTVFSQRQDSVHVWPSSRELGVGTTAAVFWSGAAAAVWSTPAEELYVHDSLMDIIRTWRTLVEVTSEFGARGDAHLVVLVNREHVSVRRQRRGFPGHPVQRWTEIRDPDSEEIARVERELRRGFGEAVWEPEPASEASEEPRQDTT
jgi:hypothetical protein